jgi:hypothetical protein
MEVRGFMVRGRDGGVSEGVGSRWTGAMVVDGVEERE